MYADDTGLARAAARGSEPAFEEIVRLYGGLIKAIVSCHLREIPAWRDDCVSDILLTVWQNIDRFDPGRSTLKNWIGAVAKYRAINFKRKYLRCLTDKELTEDIADGREADAELLRRELREEINSLLENLSPSDREIFIRRYILEQPVGEIAAASGKKPSWIYNRLSRGRKILRKSAEME